jgi:hypothetical protein
MSCRYRARLFIVLVDAACSLQPIQNNPLKQASNEDLYVA